jgi:hypothetical protein
MMLMQYMRRAVITCRISLPKRNGSATIIDATNRQSMVLIIFEKKTLSLPEKCDGSHCMSFGK